MIDLDKCKITRYPAEVLKGGVKRIEKIDDEIRALAEKMKDVMVEQKGVGLAAPQIGVALAIFVISVDGTKEHAKVYINPEISPSGEAEVCEEGCLSVPGIWAKIKRHTRCTAKATDLEGKEFVEEGEGLLARAFQHENDHLDGRLIVDRLGTAARIAVRGRLKELKDIYENGKSGQ
jgi:peptide deformylase